MRQIIAFTVTGIIAVALLSSSVLGSVSASRVVSLDLNKGDEIKVQTTFASDADTDFVYIVQIEDEERYTVFLDFHEDSVASDVSQTLLINWRSENEGTYTVKTFVLSSFENPVLLDSLIREMQVDVNGENEVECNGSAACYTGIVTRIVDGDTLDVGDTRIRLSLTNTPEIDEAGYQEAKDFTASLCHVGSRVLVDQDDLQLVDVYGRMLATVTCEDGKTLNAELLNRDHAGILTQYCADSEFSDRDWALLYGCGDVLPPQAPSSDADTEDEQSVNEDDCDPSYPTVCIPPPPPDLDCGEISYRNFEVLQPDPHGLDRDSDGIGCET